MPTETKRENGPDPKPACVELIESSRVMTLATTDASPAETPAGGASGGWAAPVYYLFDGGQFYFFSSPGARHIQEGIDGFAGASIYMDAADASNLRGLQMSGRIKACRPGKGSVKVAWAYCRRFGINCGSKDIMDFFAASYRAKLYRFSPATLLYMDNRLGMGTRTEIRL